MVAVYLTACGASLENNSGLGKKVSTVVASSQENASVTTGLETGTIKPSQTAAAKRDGNGGKDEAAGAAATPSISNPSATELAKIKAAKLAQDLSKSNNPKSSGYKLGPSDLIEITVFKVPDLSKTVQIGEGGTANIPLLGEVKVVGKTATELERYLKKAYGGKYLRNPQVSVYVKETNSQRVTVEGAVKKPGVYPLATRTTLIQIIATAQGLEEDASSTVIVFREGERGKKQAAKFDLSAIRSGTAKDPVMQPGDIVIADKSAAKAAFKNFLKAIPLVGAFAGII